METVEIDFEAVCRQLQAENEALRDCLSRERLAQLGTRFKSISRQDIAETMRDKKYWIGILVGMIFAIGFGLAPFVVDSFRRFNHHG